MSTCRPTPDVEVVGLGFSDNGRPQDKRSIYLDFDPSESPNRLIRRVIVGPPGGDPDKSLEALGDFSEATRIEPSPIPRNSTRCGRGDVVVLNEDLKTVQNSTADAHIVITRFGKKLPCGDSPQRIAFAEEIEDFSLDDALAYIQAIHEATPSPSRSTLREAITGRPPSRA